MESVFAALVLLSACGCMFCAYRLSVRKTKCGARWQWSFGASLYLFFLFFAMWRSFGAWKALDVRWPEKEQVYRVLITDSPKRSEKVVTAEALLLETEESLGRSRPEIRLSFPKDSLALTIRVGDELLFKGRVTQPENRGNPEEFDEVEYLSVKGISGRTFIETGAWVLFDRYRSWNSGLSWEMNLRMQALLLRERILKVYRMSGLQGEPFDLLAALTLGDKSGLSREMRTLYAGTGTSHVLALSGMHLGFLVVVLNFLLLRHVRSRMGKGFGAAAAVLLVWGYTFLAGIPPSLVRAAAMYSLMMFGSLCGRSGFSVNSLAATALLMLCVAPLWLYDVGFQLSFLAMLGILTVFPLFRKLPFMQWRYGGWIAQSLGVSVAAQLFTVPWVAYRFGTFALYSAWATLLVSPLTALLIYCTPLLCLAVGTGWGVFGVSKIVTGLVMLQSGCLRMIMNWPCAVCEIDCSLGGVVVSYVLLLVVFAYFGMPRVVWVKSLLTVMLVAVSVGITGWYRKRNFSALVFYNNPRCPAVHLIYAPDCSYLFPVVADSVEQKMAYISDSFWKKKLSAEPLKVMKDFRDERVMSVSGLVSGVRGVSFLILSDRRWQGMTGKHRAEVDYLYVCRGFDGNLTEMSHLFHPRCVVLDASLWSRDRERYIRECETLGWNFHDMKVKGALKVALN